MRAVETINIGLIGTGFMGKGHAMAYEMVPKIFRPAPAFPKLVVVGDVTEDLARRGARDFGAEKWVVGWEQVVADEGVDLVDITTPNNVHVEMVIKAAQAGKHVFCEKPLAMNLVEARQALAAVEEAGVIHMICHNYRRAPAVSLAKQMIEEGALGTIYHWRSHYLQDWLADPQAPALRPLAVRRLLALQRTHGNQYVQRRLHAVRPTAPGRISVLQQRDGGGAILGDSTVQVAPAGFSRGYAGLVRALRGRSPQRRPSGS